MSTIDALNQSGASGLTGSGGFSSMSSEDFTKVILAELSRQDPLQPSDTGALIQQLSGIRQIQSSMDLSKDIGTLVSQNEFSAATTLIGRKVSGISLDNERVDGVVKSVSRTNVGALVTLETGEQLLATNLDQIESVEATP